MEEVSNKQGSEHFSIIDIDNSNDLEVKLYLI